MTDRQSAPAWRRYLRFWGSNLSADISDELRFHLDMQKSKKFRVIPRVLRIPRLLLLFCF